MTKNTLRKRIEHIFRSEVPTSTGMSQAEQAKTFTLEGDLSGPCESVQLADGDIVFACDVELLGRLTATADNEQERHA